MATAREQVSKVCTCGHADYQHEQVAGAAGACRAGRCACLAFQGKSLKEGEQARRITED